MAVAATGRPVAPRSLSIDGKATLTIDPSRMIIKKPAQSTTRAIQRSRSAVDL
jgi:hypothetical protein